MTPKLWQMATLAAWCVVLTFLQVVHLKDEADWHQETLSTPDQLEEQGREISAACYRSVNQAVALLTDTQRILNEVKTWEDEHRHDLEVLLQHHAVSTGTDTSSR